MVEFPTHYSVRVFISCLMGSGLYSFGIQEWREALIIANSGKVLSVFSDGYHQRHLIQCPFPCVPDFDLSCSLLRRGKEDTLLLGKPEPQGKLLPGEHAFLRLECTVLILTY